ncbi:sterol desaturase family protein [Laceyella putida]|uniref:Sterol desaturase family protein n=1 Tax=Laceyella putida TaxID=110101 RepID=A0ABW2RF47_9BACL
MKKTVVKEFMLFPDILLTGMFFVISLALTIPHLASIHAWVAVALGMLAYAASEYFIHRFFFHMSPPNHPTLLKLVKRLHYDHHVDPNDLHLLFLPCWYSLPLISLSAGIVFLLTSSPAWTVSFVTGVVGFLLYYEWCHYIAHRPVQPLTPWGRWMKKIHLWHHFKNEHYWYGVTNPAFDLLMGTFQNEKEVEKSETVRDLERRKGGSR